MNYTVNWDNTPELGNEFRPVTAPACRAKTPIWKTFLLPRAGADELRKVDKIYMLAEETFLNRSFMLIISAVCRARESALSHGYPVATCQ